MYINHCDITKIHKFVTKNNDLLVVCQILYM